MKRALALRRIGKTAGKVLVGLIVLDLIATAVTVAMGVQWLKR